MKSYYNDKKYYIKKALKVAKEFNNEKAIELLTILQRDKNVFSLETIKLINPFHCGEIDLFNIENEG